MKLGTELFSALDRDAQDEIKSMYASAQMKLSSSTREEELAAARTASTILRYIFEESNLTENNAWLTFVPGYKAS